MGFCGADDEYDAFFSYARADDDANNGWVKQFHWYARKSVAAELRLDEAVANERADRLRLCFDKASFPQSGPLDEAIEDYVGKSEFLFLFLGRGYLKSQYCLAELEIFRNKVGGSIDEALRRTFVIVLDQDAVRRLNGPPPEALPHDREALWKRLQDFANRGIRKEDFIDGDALLPVIVHDGNEKFAAEPFHSRCAPLMREFKTKLVARSTPPDSPPHPAERPRIVLGVVPRRLEGVRAELKRELGDAGVAVLEETTLREGPEAVAARLAGCQLAVLPFDRGEVLAGRGDPPGGHLAVQQAAFEELRRSGSLASGARLLWWEPAEERPAPGEPLKPVDRFDAPFLETIRPEDRRHGSARDLATEIRGAPPPAQRRLARVWLAKNEVDAEMVKQAQDRIIDLWREECLKRRPDAETSCQILLKFYPADWQEAFRKADWARNYHGIVLVDGSNTYDALDDQVNFVDTLDAILSQEVIPGLFVVPPRASPRLEPGEWQILRFHQAGASVEAEVDQVREFVRRILDLVERQKPASPPG